MYVNMVRDWFSNSAQRQTESLGSVKNEMF